MSVDLSNLPRQVTVAAGDRIEIELPSYAGSGNVWSVAANSDEVARVDIEVAPPEHPRAPRNGSGEPPPLTLATERAVVMGIAPGETTRRLVLARSFGPPAQTAVHDLRITVEPARHC